MKPGKLKAKFIVWMHEDTLFLDDKAEEYQCMSITNDAEAVVDWAVKNITGWKRIIYRDTMGQWDELVVKDGKFAGFRHVGGKGWAEALQLARQKENNE